ncbi:hypothetical protein U6B65_08560 [Oscillospiraceae bacterium MB08-C2-2]|nr:hypothetical protein U6B65_08560 [Oscillospiraceae bacterium MB08-C2-2]
MKQKLFSNMKRLTSAFAISLLSVTLVVLVLCLTVFKDPQAVAVIGTPSEDSSQSSQPADPDAPNFTLNSKIYFARPDSSGNLLFTNPAENSYKMSVNIILQETDKSVLFTGFVDPGESQEKKKLNVELAEGVYPCIAEITVYDLNTFEPKGTTKAEVTLYIGQKP